MENLLACYTRINCTPKSYFLICCPLGNLWMESNSLSLDVMRVMWPRSNREPCGYLFEERILVSVQQRNKYDYSFPVVERNWIRKQKSIIFMLQYLGGREYSNIAFALQLNGLNSCLQSSCNSRYRLQLTINKTVFSSFSFPCMLKVFIKQNANIWHR